ncbi:MAG: tRNA (adenosine(37)-N6)-threonylcarbamoyltransferase complex transferase subunit TsaD [Candidatus Omnitrophota bacterium]|jgi:N6-L-threonylcarbamoyladenine synthase
MYTLGIETSCDETSCAILKDYDVLSNVTISSLNEHKKYGGVVPEIATRAHLKNIDKVFLEALRISKVSLKDISLVAATYKPGLMGSLVVGVNFAKALALALNKPFLGINHLHAHIFAPFLNRKEKIKFPLLGFIVSGGHTEIYYINDFDRIKLLGQTDDDACGEVFDKVAKAYGLGYPGGPAIDRLFESKYKDAFSFKCGRRGLNLSFSGIKTALIYKKIELEKKAKLTRLTKIKLISSFQYSAVEALVAAISSAHKQYKVKKIACGGGVIANRYLRARLKECESKNLKFLVPPIEYTADNAAVVAGLGFYLYNKKGIKSTINLEAEAS